MEAFKEPPKATLPPPTDSPYIHANFKFKSMAERQAALKTAPTDEPTAAAPAAAKSAPLSPDPTPPGVAGGSPTPPECPKPPG